MVGSTLIYEPNHTKLVALSNIDNIDDFIYLDLDYMMTIDFSTLLLGEDVRWCEKEPVIYDPESGIALLKIDPEGLQRILDQAGNIDGKFSADIEKISKFINKYGFNDIYERSTF